MTNTLERFRELFTGGNHAYGLWDIVRGAATKQGAASDIQYEEHLSGKLGLGLVPVQQNGLCRFAAIDIDIDTIDHGRLFAEVSKNGFPCNVCRSKSGGAHLYVFFKNPGLNASKVQALLKRWAMALGYPNAEIFPKQQRIGPDNVGNWINLPYFGGDGTTRYAVGPAGALSLIEFLDTVKYYDPDVVIPVSSGNSVAQLPPCLAKLQQEGIAEGSRNVTVFNLAVFYKKSDPEGWENSLQKHNAQYVSPPLGLNDMRGVVASVSRKGYQYTCKDPLIQQYCDKPACLKLPFGVGFSDNGVGFHQPVFGQLEKLNSDPPRYTLEIDGKSIELSWVEFYKNDQFRSKVGEKLDLILQPQKQDAWAQQVGEMLAVAKQEEAPEDSSVMGLVIDRLHAFIANRERAQSREDLQRNLPVTVGDQVYFKGIDLQKFLQGSRLDKVPMGEIFSRIKKIGASIKKVRVNGQVISVWTIPIAMLNEQTQQFTPANFKNDFDPEL